MQYHAIVLDTKGTTYGRQQPRHVNREKKRKNKNKQKENRKGKIRNEKKEND